MEVIPDKFKTAEDLAHAYAELETAFTKKCQEVAALRARLAENAPEPAQTESDAADPGEAGVRDGDAAKFFAQFPQARPDAAALAELLAAERVVDYVAMLTAYNRLLAQRVRPAEAWAEDEAFLEGYIYPSERVKEHFYAAFSDEPGAPKMLRTGRGALSAPTRPSTLAEAAELARRMLNRY